MSQLDAVVLNGEALGSGSRVNAYGGAIVSGAASQSQYANGTLTLAGTVRHMYLAQPMVVLAALSPRATPRASGPVFGAATEVGSLTPRCISHLLTDGSSAGIVLGSAAYRIQVVYRLTAHQIMAVNYALNGIDLSRTLAPQDRITYVPVSDRASYAMRD